MENTVDGPPGLNAENIFNSMQCRYHLTYKSIITMKKECAVFLAVLLFLFAGCSILQKERKQSVIGTWTGKGIVANRGVHRDWDVTLTFGEDSTMTLSYGTGDQKITLGGSYTVDLSKRPARIDITNYGFPKSDTRYCCLAIAEFPEISRMSISGLLGQCGKISRPTEFNRNPSDHRQLYLELTKKE